MFIDGVIKKEQLGFDSLHSYVEYIKQENGGAFFVPMLIAGLPNVPACAEIIFQLENNGAKMIELFVPTHDAFLEDIQITKAMDHALANNLHLSDCFDLVSLVRQRGCRVPIILRSYFSSVFNYGLSKFIKKCHLSGINVLKIQNLPLAKIHEISPYLRRNKVEFTCSLGKKQEDKHILAIRNPANNISMVYKNIVVLNTDNPTAIQKSIVDEHVIDEINTLKEATTKNIAICGSFQLNDENNIENLSHVIDELDAFSFKSYLTPFQYIQNSEVENFQDKILYEQNNIIINRVVEKAKAYINVKKLLEDYAKKGLNIPTETPNIDIDNLIDNEVTIDVIDLKTKEEREKERKEQEKALELKLKLNNNVGDDIHEQTLVSTSEDQGDSLGKKDEINETVDTTILVDNKKKEKPLAISFISREPTAILETGGENHD